MSMKESLDLKNKKESAALRTDSSNTPLHPRIHLEPLELLQLLSSLLPFLCFSLPTSKTAEFENVRTWERQIVQSWFRKICSKYRWYHNTMDKTVAYLHHFTHLWPRLPRKWCAQLHIAHTQAMEISCHFHLSDEASRGCWPIQMKEYKWKTSIIVTQRPFFIGFSHIPTHSRTATMRTHAMHTPYDPLYIGLHINLCIPFAAKKDASWQHHETYELPFCCKQSCPYL